MQRSAGRPEIDLSQYKDEIIEKFQARTTACAISQYLLTAYNIRVKEKTIRTRLLEWGYRRNNKHKDDPQLRSKIAVLFYQCCLSDKTIVNVLRRDGIEISPRNLKEIRLRMGLKRRINPEHQEEADQALLAIVQKELDKGCIEGLGRGHLYSYFRNNMHIASRDRLFSAIRKLDPDGITRRLNDLQRHRGEYIVPGPNYIWSIDRYCKLQFFGIEVYAAIDAYSRYVIWIYVGISNRTAVSILRQYVDTLQGQQVLPQILRADRGVETPLIASAHHKFIQAVRPDASFDGCFRYGTSTANQRIEAWWGQLTKSVLYRWRDFFHQLSNDHLFQRDLLADRIAILAIYMPILRTEIHAYVRLWNAHSIRRQPRRPNCVSGQPIVLYHWPDDGVQDYGIKPDSTLLTQLQGQLGDFSINDYLPESTKTWCHNKLKDLGYPRVIDGGQSFPDGSRLHYRAYLQLRECVRQHIESQEEPVLELLKTPTGAWSWEGFDTTSIGEMDIYGEGPDSLATEDDFTFNDQEN